MNPQAHLLGCMVLANTPGTVLEIARVVPVEAFDAPIDRAVFAAMVDLARANQWKPRDPNWIAAKAHANGYPRDQRATVALHVFGLMEGCWWPQWRSAVAEVRETYTRRRCAAALAGIEQALSTGDLNEIAGVLADTCDMVRVSVEINEGLRADGGEAA